MLRHGSFSLHRLLTGLSVVSSLLVALSAQADDLYIGQGNSNRIVRYTDQGVPVGVDGLFTQFSGYPDPQDLAFGANGNLYVANYLGKNVMELDGSTGAEIRTLSNAGFQGLRNLAVDTNGNLFVSDTPNNQVYKIDPLTGEIVMSYNVAGPTGLAFDPNGNLLAGSYATNQVLSIDTSTGTSSVFATGVNAVGDLAIGPDGRYYATGFGIGQLYAIGSSGGAASLFATIHGGEQYPNFLTFTAGKMYVTISNPGTVQAYDLSGNYLGEFGTPDGNITGITVRPSAPAAVPRTGVHSAVGIAGAGRALRAENAPRPLLSVSLAGLVLCIPELSR